MAAMRASTAKTARMRAGVSTCAGAPSATMRPRSSATTRVAYRAASVKSWPAAITSLPSRELFSLDIANRLLIQKNRTAIRFDQARESGKQRRFSCTIRTDDCDEFTRARTHIDAVKDRAAIADNRDTGCYELGHGEVL